MNKHFNLIATTTAALALSAGMTLAQAPMGGAQELGGDGPRRLRVQQGIDAGAEVGGRAERREMREQRRELRQSQEDTAGTVRIERERDRGDRVLVQDRRDREERLIIRERNRDRDRGPNIRLRFGGPDVYVRTLPPLYRYVVVGGARCRVTITRRVNARGRIVTVERRKCPGRPEVIVRTRY